MNQKSGGYKLGQEVICKVCSFENIENSSLCENCGTELIENDVKCDEEFFVRCEDCRTETVVESKDQDNFYCEECGENKTIDGFSHSVLVRKVDQSYSELQSEAEPVPTLIKQDLILEEIKSKHQITIDRDGGTVGRYGDFGADFFRENNMLMISGEHILISYNQGDWYLEHLSNTNLTLIDNIVLEKGLKFKLYDESSIKLANMTFKVVLGESDGN